jgi:hypothetical protein
VIVRVAIIGIEELTGIRERTRRRKRRRKKNGKGLLFVCQNCHYTVHANLVGARNVTMRTLLLQQDWGKTGHLSIVPDASDKEAKAARLIRYAELRWSPDASLRLLAGGH